MSSGNNGGLPPNDIPDSYNHRIPVNHLQSTPSDGSQLRNPQLCVLDSKCRHKMYRNDLYMTAATTAEFLHRRELAILEHLVRYHAIEKIQGRPPMILCTACAVFSPQGAMILVENLARHINLVHQPPAYPIEYCILLEKKCRCKMYGSKLYARPVSAREFYIRRGELISTHLLTIHGIPGVDPQAFLCEVCYKVGRNFVVREDNFADHVNEYHQPPVFDILLIEGAGRATGVER